MTVDEWFRVIGLAILGGVVAVLGFLAFKGVFAPTATK
jgi:hypothetical protein